MRAADSPPAPPPRQSKELSVNKKRTRALAAACSAILLGALVPVGAALAQDTETGKTRISGLIFLNASHQDRELGSDNLNVDLKRFWLNFDHQFNQDWSL